LLLLLLFLLLLLWLLLLLLLLSVYPSPCALFTCKGLPMMPMAEHKVPPTSPVRLMLPYAERRASLNTSLRLPTLLVGPQQPSLAQGGFTSVQSSINREKGVATPSHVLVKGPAVPCPSPDSPTRLGSQAWPEAAAARCSQRRHTDPGKNVKLQVMTKSNLQNHSLACDWHAVTESLQHVLTGHCGHSSPASTERVTLTTLSSLGSSEGTQLPASGDDSHRHVRFRTDVSLCEVSTPYGRVYDGVHPMDFDFNRFGQKVFKVYPVEPVEEQANRFGME